MLESIFTSSLRRSLGAKKEHAKIHTKISKAIDFSKFNLRDSNDLVNGKIKFNESTVPYKIRQRALQSCKIHSCMYENVDANYIKQIYYLMTLAEHFKQRTFYTKKDSFNCAEILGLDTPNISKGEVLFKRTKQYLDAKSKNDPLEPIPFFFDKWTFDGELDLPEMTLKIKWHQLTKFNDYKQESHTIKSEERASKSKSEVLMYSPEYSKVSNLFEEYIEKPEITLDEISNDVTIRTFISKKMIKLLVKSIKEYRDSLNVNDFKNSQSIIRRMKSLRDKTIKKVEWPVYLKKAPSISIWQALYSSSVLNTKVSANFPLQLAREASIMSKFMNNEEIKDCELHLLSRGLSDRIDTETPNIRKKPFFKISTYGVLHGKSVKNIEHMVKREIKEAIEHVEPKKATIEPKTELKENVYGFKIRIGKGDSVELFANKSYRLESGKIKSFRSHKVVTPGTIKLSVV